MVRKRTYPLAIWAGIVFSVALSASALYWDANRVVLAPSSEWATLAQIRAEYREATKRLQLPSGRMWPEQLPYNADSGDGSGCAYGAGVGTEWAEWYWFDAWAAAAASAEESSLARADAVAALPEFYATQAFATTAEPAYFRELITAAEKGDLSPLREYVDTLDPIMTEGE